MDLSDETRTGQEQESGHWSSIPREVFSSIAGKIVSIADYVRFAGACRAWYSLAADFKPNRFGPLYMRGTGPNSTRVTLRDPASGAALALDLPETVGSRCWGSPFGWIVAYDRDGSRLNLLNPLTGAIIALPSFPRSRSGSGWEQWFPTKAFMMAGPEADQDKCLALIAWGRKLAFVRSGKGKKVWSRISGDLNLIDIIYHKDNLYGLEHPTRHPNTNLVKFRLNHRHKGKIVPDFVRFSFDPVPEAEINMHPTLPKGSYYSLKNRLVDLNGELCLCERRNSNDHTTIDFKVYKIDLSTGKFTRILSLGDHCLFLGNNYSFSFKASYPPADLFEQPKCEPCEFVSNYMFYAHCPNYYYPSKRFDVEVWDMSSSTIKVRRPKASPTPMYGPLWFLPSLSFRKLENNDRERSAITFEDTS